MTTIRHLNIEVTRRCDQHCTYCFNDSGPAARHPEMTIDKWLAFIRHMSLRGLRSLHITGGEPFASSATVPVLREAQSLGLSTSILSNGLRIPTVAEQEPVLLRNLSVAQISLDSMDPSVHDLRRGKSGAWKQALLAMDALRELRVPLEVSCTVDEENLGHAYELAAFARSIGASLILRPLLPLGRASFASSRQARVPTAPGTDSFADVLVRDRFRYLPDGPRSDRDALDSGILTILPDGRFRAGFISASGPCVGSSAVEVLEAA